MVLFKILLSCILYTKGGISIRKILSLIILSFLICAFNLDINASTFEKTIIIGGESIGLELNSKVHIIGFYEVETDNKKVSPWENSNILEGDIIISIDNQKVESNADIANLIKNKDKVRLKLLRDGENYIKTDIKVVKNKNGKESIGLYVKDKILGVGTMTYIDPETQTYGALGHSVANGEDQGQLLLSTIKSIRKASPGVPGEKYAVLSTAPIGTITKNTEIGIFGKINNVRRGSHMKVQEAKNVRPGKAQLLTVVHGDSKEFFDIEIIEVRNQKTCATKGIKLKITDTELLSETGGIIQGMSGSPIIQDGYLVGALSHVVISSPQIGYGVFAQWMIEEGCS
ncbi:MAG TPA: SpoIVB peptidase [Acholeplasmataceae bacterium]|nr:SpoIVB peptidase [Acholeplasmataceae bacterium]